LSSGRRAVEVDGVDAVGEGRLRRVQLGAGVRDAADVRLAEEGCLTVGGTLAPLAGAAEGGAVGAAAVDVGLVPVLRPVGAARARGVVTVLVPGAARGGGGRAGDAAPVRVAVAGAGRAVRPRGHLLAPADVVGARQDGAGPPTGAVRRRRAT